MTHIATGRAIKVWGGRGKTPPAARRLAGHDDADDADDDADDDDDDLGIRVRPAARFSADYVGRVSNPREKFVCPANGRRRGRDRRNAYAAAVGDGREINIKSRGPRSRVSVDHRPSSSDYHHTSRPQSDIFLPPKRPVINTDVLP